MSAPIQTSWPTLHNLIKELISLTPETLGSISVLRREEGTVSLDFFEKQLLPILQNLPDLRFTGLRELFLKQVKRLFPSETEVNLERFSTLFQSLVPNSRFDGDKLITAYPHVSKYDPRITVAGTTPIEQLTLDTHAMRTAGDEKSWFIRALGAFIEFKHKGSKESLLLRSPDETPTFIQLALCALLMERHCFTLLKHLVALAPLETPEAYSLRPGHILNLALPPHISAGLAILYNQAFSLFFWMSNPRENLVVKKEAAQKMMDRIEQCDHILRRTWEVDLKLSRILEEKAAVRLYANLLKKLDELHLNSFVAKLLSEKGWVRWVAPFLNAPLNLNQLYSENAQEFCEQAAPLIDLYERENERRSNFYRYLVRQYRSLPADAEMPPNLAFPGAPLPARLPKSEASSDPMSALKADLNRLEKEHPSLDNAPITGYALGLITSSAADTLGTTLPLILDNWINYALRIKIPYRKEEIQSLLPLKVGETFGFLYYRQTAEGIVYYRIFHVCSESDLIEVLMTAKVEIPDSAVLRELAKKNHHPHPGGGGGRYPFIHTPSLGVIQVLCDPSWDLPELGERTFVAAPLFHEAFMVMSDETYET